MGSRYVGTLPSAEVYRYDGDHRWTLSACVDDTPDVIYRRAWSMAIHAGRLFVGTLPSGRVHALRTGAVATADTELGAGWRSVAAVRTAAQQLQLFVDGVLVGESEVGAAAGIELDSDVPLRVGAGPLGPFAGTLRDFKLEVGVALDAVELARRAAAPGL